MVSNLQIELVWNVQRRQFLAKLQCIGIIRLIFAACAQVVLERPGRFSRRQHIGGAVLANVVWITAPNAAFCAVVSSERDYKTKNVRMMEGDVGCPKATHRETSNRPMCHIRKCTILRIDVLHEVYSHVGFYTLALIEAIPPLAGCAGASIAIGQDHNQFRYLAKRDQGIGGLVGLARGKPVPISAW